MEVSLMRCLKMVSTTGQNIFLVRMNKCQASGPMKKRLKVNQSVCVVRARQMEVNVMRFLLIEEDVAEFQVAVADLHCIAHVPQAGSRIEGPHSEEVVREAIRLPMAVSNVLGPLAAPFALPPRPASAIAGQ